MSLPDKHIRCPATGFVKTCRDIYIETEGGCPKYICVAGTNPNTGEQVNQYGCADTFIPILLIENSQQQRQTGAAVESFRNEMVKANENSHHLIRLSMQNNPLTLENRQ